MFPNFMPDEVLSTGTISIVGSTSSLSTTTGGDSQIITPPNTDQPGGLNISQSLTTLDYSFISALLLLWIALILTIDLLRRLGAKKDL